MQPIAIENSCACGSGRLYAVCCGAGDARNAAVEALFREAIRAHRQGQVTEAVQLYEQVLIQAPEHPGSLFFLGATHLEAGRPGVALPSLRESLRLQPERNPNAWYALGLAAHMSGERELAAEGYRQALRRAPGFAGARANLAEVLREAGQVEEAASLLQEDPEVGRDPERLVNLANLRVDQGQYAEAESLYRQALTLRPGDSIVLNNLAGLLLKQHRPDEALAVLDQAASRLADSAEFWHNRGWVLSAMKREDEACDAYEKATVLDPDHFKSWAAWAMLEERRHRLEQAADLARRAVALTPQHPDSVALRVVLSKCYRRDNQPERALAEIEAVKLDPGSPPATQRQYLFERGAVLDAMGRYDEAFAAYQSANEATLVHRREQSQYDAAGNESLARRLMAFFTRERVQALTQLSPRLRPDLACPVFVTGFPRSGTTLIEQILASHPGITAGDELSYLTEFTSNIARELRSTTAYPECLTDLAFPANHDSLEQLQQYYLERAAQAGLPANGNLLFTDKMPRNEWHLGLVRLIFPVSPVIHVVRHPLDACLSNYFTKMTHGRYGSYRLETVAHHYVLSYRLAEHYRQHLGLRFQRIRYEDLIDDFESQVRQLLDFVGVPFDERCLAFHENKRVARTASYAQVNQKLYTSSRYRYRHYRKHIEPMIPILEPVIHELGYAIDDPG